MIGTPLATSASRAGRIGLGLAALGLALAGCGSLPGYGEAGSSTNVDKSSSTGGGVSLSVSDTDLGEILVGNDDMTLYMWKMDEGTQSACEDACATAWPPVTTTGAPDMGDGVVASLVGTTFRSDGSMQVTYDGHPLYYFKKDTESGDVNGQGSKGFGAAWWVMSGAGAIITAPKDAAAGSDAKSPAPATKSTSKAKAKSSIKKTPTPKKTVKSTPTKDTAPATSGGAYDYGSY